MSEVRFRVRALHTIRGSSDRADVVIPKGMMGSCFGATRIAADTVTLKVQWDHAAVIDNEAESHNYVVPSWEQDDVNPDHVEVTV